MGLAHRLKTCLNCSSQAWLYIVMPSGTLESTYFWIPVQRSRYNVSGVWSGHRQFIPMHFQAEKEALAKAMVQGTWQILGTERSLGWRKSCTPKIFDSYRHITDTLGCTFALSGILSSNILLNILPHVEKYSLEIQYIAKKRDFTKIQRIISD